MEKKEDGILKKAALIGVGAVAVGVEKTDKVLDELAEYGRKTVEAGKVANEELKHQMKKNQTSTPVDVEKLSEEERAALLKKLQEFEKKDK